MAGDAKRPENEPPRERRSRERVADDADWETKVLARVRGSLRRGSSDAAEPQAGDTANTGNWEEQAAAAMEKHLKNRGE